MAICTLSGDAMKPFIRVMKALSDPNRVRVLKLLGVKALCVCEIRELIGLAQSTVSKHLKILEEAGLVDYHKEGSWIIYRLTKGEESDYAAVMLEHLAGWQLADDQPLQEMMSRIAFVNKVRSCAA